MGLNCLMILGHCTELLHQRRCHVNPRALPYSALLLKGTRKNCTVIIIPNDNNQMLQDCTTITCMYVTNLKYNQILYGYHPIMVPRKSSQGIASQSPMQCCRTCQLEPDDQLPATAVYGSGRGLSLWHLFIHCISQYGPLRKI